MSQQTAHTAGHKRPHRCPANKVQAWDGRWLVRKHIEVMVFLYRYSLFPILCILFFIYSKRSLKIDEETEVPNRSVTLVLNGRADLDFTERPRGSAMDPRPPASRHRAASMGRAFSPTRLMRAEKPNPHRQRGLLTPASNKAAVRTSSR